MWSREISSQIVKLYLTSEKMNEELRKAILQVKIDYPEKYFNSYFNEAHKWKHGIGSTNAGPGTNYLLGYLDTVKELSLDITLVIEATKKWRSNKKREQAINEWLTQNT